eukprot:4318493-Pyramimonas_sp.AAC.1
MTVQHKFSCENVPFKQDFLKWFFPTAALFPDLNLLNSSITTDVDDAPQRIPQALMFTCGIECDSISPCNVHRSDNHGCVSKEGDDAEE